MSNQVQALLAGHLFASCGFQPAQSTNIPAILRRISPDGGTAMRDSLIQGCQLMLKLSNALKQMGTADHYNFVHVILTDGKDEHSKNTLQQAAKAMIIIGQLIPVKTLKIIFIGVGVDQYAQKELMLLAAAGGQNAEYYNVNSSGIQDIFNKIEIGLGIQKNLKMMGVTSSQGNALFLKQEYNPYLQIKVKNFAVMFNLDVSGSMSGNKWTNVCSSVGNFIQKMGNTDLVSGLVFNNEVKLISSIKQNDKLVAKQRPVSQKGVTFYVQNGQNQEQCTIM